MSLASTSGELRSARWFDSDDLSGLIHRSALRAEGFTSSAFRGRPVVGVCNSWSELVNCNIHFRALAEAVKRGVLHAGGIPLEFPTISLGEQLMKPTTMLYRNLMAMDVEECLRSYPLDAVVLLGGCDKTIPAQLMGAASVDLPTIVVSGGPAQASVFRGRELGVGTDLWRYVDEYRAGQMSATDFNELEAALGSSSGHCNEMGTALTMACVAEAIGMTLPGCASIPAADARRYAIAERSGARAVQLARSGPRPSEIMTSSAFDNAITVLMALGGSTNAVIHLLALAGRVGVDLTLRRFDELSHQTPVLTNLQPSGRHLAAQFHNAGGVPALMAELSNHLTEASAVSGLTLSERSGRTGNNSDVIAGCASPFRSEGGIAVLTGNLAPDGALIKTSAASPDLLRHRGPAVVFEDIDDLASRIDDPDLDVDQDSVLVLRNAGPKGAPGMPEWGALPIPKKLLARGVRDMVRVSDARMSGTAFGTNVVHVAPEAAARGPLSVVHNGDVIALDVDQRSLVFEVEATEIHRRLDMVQPAQPRFRRGYVALYVDNVLQANTGCDLAFLRGQPETVGAVEPAGMLVGWIGGW
jgi:dihydroxy-acid dehydratase